MYTCATMAYSIQLQTILTDICGVKKQEKRIQTSNKKHFMKNVKECRDVIVKKYWNKVGTLSSKAYSLRVVVTMNTISLLQGHQDHTVAQVGPGCGHTFF